MEISFIRNIVKAGKSNLVITVPTYVTDLFPPGTKVKVVRIPKEEME